jgi:NADH-quinone oxidoreductase subunit I
MRRAPACVTNAPTYNRWPRKNLTFCCWNPTWKLQHRRENEENFQMLTWFRNVFQAVATVGQGMGVTLVTMLKTYQAKRKTFTDTYAYPEVPIKVKPRYRGFHRFDLTTCIGCEKCAQACPVDCIYIEKEKSPVGKGFRLNGFAVDYTKCMFCALCVEPCPVDCIFMGSNHDLSCYSRDGCIVDYAKLPLQIAWGKATLNPAAVAESKVLHEPVWVKGEESPFEFAEA